MLPVLTLAATTRFNYSAALILEEKALKFVVENLFVDVIHLLTLYQGHNIQVLRQLLLAFLE